MLKKYLVIPVEFDTAGLSKVDYGANEGVSKEE